MSTNLLKHYSGLRSTGQSFINIMRFVGYDRYINATMFGKLNDMVGTFTTRTQTQLFTKNNSRFDDVFALFFFIFFNCKFFGENHFSKTRQYIINFDSSVIAKISQNCWKSRVE